MLSLRVCLDPLASLGHHRIAIRHQLVNQTNFLGFIRFHALTLHQHLHQAILDTQHAHDTGHATAAGQQAQRYFRQTELGGFVIDGNAVMTGQCDFQTATQSRAVHGRNHRLAQCFQDPQLTLDLGHTGQKLRAIFLARLQQITQVTARKKGFLGRGNDHPGNLVFLFFQTLDHRRHGLAVQLVHGIGRLVGIIQGQNDDIVRVFFPTNSSLFTHIFTPKSFDAAYRRSMMVAIPMPPPTHKVHNANFLSRRSSSSSAVPRIMAPVAPSG